MSVHEHVDEGVGDHEDAVIASRVGHEEKTNHGSNTAVVIHMKEGDLAERLAEYEQEGINVFPVLLNVVDVHKLGMSSNRQCST